MGTTSNFDLTQTAFLFNWAANSSGAVSGKAADLADFVYSYLFSSKAAPNSFKDYDLPGLLPTLGQNLYGGDWQLKWGPGVYVMDTLNPFHLKADNTAFVMFNPGLNTYIVAIAGTDPKAFLDWLKEDFKVGPKECVNWDGFSPYDEPKMTDADAGQPQLSYGTAYGIWALGSKLTLSQYAPSGQATLADFLSKGIQASPGCQIIFTGHSLGGALSPTLANWTRNLNLPNVTVLALPTAGATPGNNNYQAAWDLAFPVTPAPGTINSGNLVGNFNCDVWNTQDVVPHAWVNIYTQDVQPGSTPPEQQYYFSTPYATQSTALMSLLGPLEPGTLFGNFASGRQTAGAEAGMTRSAHTLPFPTIWPLEYIDEDGNSTTQPEPFGPYTGDDSLFLGTLAHIHVWGYGACAFGIDLSVFSSIRPIKN